MRSKDRIITVGLSPAWDVSCRGRDLQWGRHLNIDEQVVRAAGKALNVSAALAWLGRSSIAAGLWGRDDRAALRSAVAAMSPLIDLDMTFAAGRTRNNITVVDTQNRREMHLRLASCLATANSLRRLNGHLQKTVGAGDLCVFAGSMPVGDLLDPALALVQTCRRQGARIVVDSYGPVMDRVVEEGWPWLIAPNLTELADLLGQSVKDAPTRLVAAARPLLERVPVILISRGRRGALVVTKKGAWTGRTTTPGKALETVGCGDYLLAGFLAGCGGSLKTALAAALKVATARAWGWAETHTWTQIRRTIDVEVKRV